MSPSSPHTNPHHIPRTALLSKILSVVLPSQYSTISTRFSKIARLHHSTRHDPLATDRADALNALRVELGIFEKNLSDYTDLVDGINIMDIAELE
ncbi:hypothetical protein Ptr902_02506 [Pyrenophora tritici-repentis]|nr:hypothetical protein PtrV1_09106 [Pyrenophora tritici-repentis]KAF7443346.1 hypothetical protein A1F99_128530 [Pyrenophora tritici-repentis]KAI0621197.1 hypothetical protein TUN199_06811 [Pyrenophora tritici-repentis]KAI1567791.1 hypothetical protein PtrEW4_006830 [Pyrenophora tritici-repentis]KAI2488373.1 hypothetical protein Ptr902_02506 [Pyrenophora tritici-repentis]